MGQTAGRHVVWPQAAGVWGRAPPVVLGAAVASEQRPEGCLGWGDRPGCGGSTQGAGLERGLARWQLVGAEGLWSSSSPPLLLDSRSLLGTVISSLRRPCPALSAAAFHLCGRGRAGGRRDPRAFASPSLIFNFKTCGVSGGARSCPGSYG